MTTAGVLRFFLIDGSVDVPIFFCNVRVLRQSPLHMDAASSDGPHDRRKDCNRRIHLYGANFFCRFCLAGRGCGYGDLGIVRPIVKLKIKLSTRGIIGKKESSVQRNNRGFWGDGGTRADNFTARERFDRIKSLLWTVLAGAKITNQ
jgi:hypothetical protein